VWPFAKVVEVCALQPGDEAIHSSFKIEGCNTNIYDSVMTTFSGSENLKLPGLQVLDGASAATEVAVGIETDTDTW